MPRDFKTVLCPVDFSDESFHALEYGLRFARLSNGLLLVAHVLHNPSDEFFHPEGYVITWDEAKARAQKMLEEARARRLEGYSPTELIVDIGDPYERIVGIARDRRADLIVVSTHGRSGFSHLLLGSVAEKVIRHAPCPVFVVRQNVD